MQSNEANLKEKDLEEAIEKSLIDFGGYKKGDPENFNRATALDEKTFLDFIKKTQPKEWERHKKNYPDNPEDALLKRFQDEVSETNLLNILRHGFIDRGVSFKVCFFKPETSFNEEALTRYKQNILHCTRQLKFSLLDERSIDIVLFINGIPVVTMELKNQFTGQDVNNAIKQYKFDRATKDKLFEFKRRSLVHFAVDLYNVYMTTKLAGGATYFLPFNQGSNGAGNVGGKGNPQIKDDFITSYLWKEILKKDTLLEIIQKYMHLQSDDKRNKDGEIVGKKEVMIFPRYHQLDVVRKLLHDVKENGCGKNYLIQHSAGSGKSNSIAWLAHRLQSLHDKNDNIIFNSVIVVTDRRVLDSQLQATISQFDHVKGVVRSVKQGSRELKEALDDGIKIIVTTIQKFPYIYEDIQSTGKKYAVIVDEAHSSQTGNSAKKLKIALSDTEEILERYANEEAKNEEDEDKKQDEYEDKIFRELATHGQHKNLSFFAFTATPKNKTLQIFGDKQPDGSFRPFHIYSMKQAIEEGFILDVLQNYTTYQQYFKIAKKIKGDPEYDKSKGTRAVSRFESLHPHNIAQKTSIIIEHFRDITKNKIDGRAKAMVVTSSRLHAVRYFLEFGEQIREHNYNDLDVLVAFSGEVVDPDTKKEFTEEKLNEIKESQLKQEFHDNFNMLIVAEKYQTGFDEPYLHTMFVDKKLNGVKAVQTLSRLNRTMKGKEDTFVLDFVNTHDEIRDSFQPFYEATNLTEETDPNLVYTQKRNLEDFNVIRSSEVEAFAKKFYQKSIPTLDALSSILTPAIERYNDLVDEEKDGFKSILYSFIRTYSFITQVCRMFDKELNNFYQYAKYLVKVLPKDNSEAINLNDKLLLEYYRLQKTAEGRISLESKEGELPPQSGGGQSAKEKEKDTLSKIIEKINERYGTDFTEQDKVLSQIKADFMKDESIVRAGKNGDKTAFNTLYEKMFKKVMLERYEKNDDFFKRLMNNEDMLNFLKNELHNDLYNELRNS